MQWLPRVHTPNAPWRLPLCPGTAVRLVEAIQQADGQDPSPQTLVAILESDPALALWAIGAARRADRHATLFPTLAELATWLAPRWFELTRTQPTEPQAPETSAAEADCDAEPGGAAKLAEAAAQAIAAAQRAARLAGERGLDSQRAYLLALVARPEAWIRPATTSGVEFCREIALEIARDESLAGCVQAAWLETANADTPAAAAARDAWHGAPPPHGLLCYLADLTLRLREQTEQFVARLEQAKLESLKELAYGAGHEINNPLANISARAQTLLREETDPNRRRMLASIQSQAQRAHEMIADLMLFARPPQPVRQPMDLTELCRQLAGELAPAAIDQQSVLHWRLPEEPIRLMADRVQLAVAIRALCINSLEALVTGGRIEVSLELADAQTVRLTVSDNGPGVPAAARTRIFDPYYSGREAGRGLGLGLSKCWRIVTLHGGQIELAGGAGPGATFVITLPTDVLPPGNAG